MITSIFFVKRNIKTDLFLIEYNGYSLKKPKCISTVNFIQIRLQIQYAFLRFEWLHVNIS